MQEEIVNINKAYKKNKELNRNIIHLINKIFSTYSLFAKKGKFSYQLMNNLIYNTRVNLPVATKVEASSNIGYQKINDLIEFYNNNYIFGRNYRSPKTNKGGDRFCPNRWHDSAGIDKGD